MKVRHELFQSAERTHPHDGKSTHQLINHLSHPCIYFLYSRSMMVSNLSSSGEGGMSGRVAE